MLSNLNSFNFKQEDFSTSVLLVTMVTHLLNGRPFRKRAFQRKENTKKLEILKVCLDNLNLWVED